MRRGRTPSKGGTRIDQGNDSTSNRVQFIRPHKAERVYLWTDHGCAAIELTSVLLQDNQHLAERMWRLIAALWPSAFLQQAQPGFRLESHQRLDLRTISDAATISSFSPRREQMFPLDSEGSLHNYTEVCQGITNDVMQAYCNP
jgi:hypothetical protein